jgi:hypothetical protein
VTENEITWYMVGRKRIEIINTAKVGWVGLSIDQVPPFADADGRKEGISREFGVLCSDLQLKTSKRRFRRKYRICRRVQTSGIERASNGSADVWGFSNNQNKID